MEKYNGNNHVMVDIETLGVGSTPVIAQLSAIRFNPMTGKTYDEFNSYICIASCLKEELMIDQGTLEWWNTQPKEVRDKVLYDGKRENIVESLNNFNDFLGIIKNVNIWGKGPSFDCSILSNTCDKLKVEKKWGFWNEKCVRTVIALHPEVKDLKFEGEKHNGLDDCKHQIKQVSKVFRKLFPAVDTEKAETITSDWIDKL